MMDFGLFLLFAAINDAEKFRTALKLVYFGRARKDAPPRGRAYA